MATVLRYVLLQIPGAALLGIMLYLAVQWEWMSGRLALWVMAIWLVKDALLFPVYRPALEGGQSPGPESMIGRTGISLTSVQDKGLIQIHGERWRARSRNGEFIPRADTVRVVAHERLLLIVERVRADEEKDEGDAKNPD
ncbi:NfeD family protein [Natronospira bacteriovora]|uniref:NfeD family protein n=1 Tax=Natronospira bacteriovora TaxID=3069753 RepID=A0ABU0W7R0_9GAMM|nr:NfeD family protein [Natronospira sp. AB-CW4]MDQ2070026.1 NfeD family protein [Natronospira sp. AB-CW4]